jgi:hypothetical protein
VTFTEPTNQAICNSFEDWLDEMNIAGIEANDVFEVRPIYSLCFTATFFDPQSTDAMVAEVKELIFSDKNERVEKLLH